MSTFQNDLTQGSVSKQLIRFSIPFLLSNIIQALYSVADMLIVGWYFGENGISGVSIGSQVTMLVTNLVVGFTVGGTVLIAQYFGAKKMEDVRESIGTLFTLLIAAAVVMTLVFSLLANPILELLRTPAESYADTYSYLIICLFGTIFIFGYNAVSSILRGLGDSKRPLYFVAIACVANVVLDFIFVGALKLSSAGAAYATVVSQALSLVLSVIYLCRNNFIFDFKLKSFLPKLDKVKKIISLGLPSSIQNTVSSISFLLMTALANDYGGVSASAAIGIVGKFNGFAILPAIAMSSSVSSMAGQNIGAGLYDRAKKTMWIALRISLLISVLIFAFVQLFPETVLRLFSDKEAVITDGVKYLRSFSFDYLFVSFFFCFNGLIIGAGHTTFSLINGVLCSVLLRMPIAYVFGYTFDFGLAGIGAAAPGATLGAICLCSWFIATKRWQKGGLKIHAETAETAA